MARRIACRCRSRPSSPSHAMSAAYSRSWLRSKQPPPSAKHARPRGPKPSEPHGSGLQERICSSSCLSWLPPSQELEPPAIPGRFKLDDPRTFDEALKNITGIFLITGYTVDMLLHSKS